MSTPHPGAGKRLTQSQLAAAFRAYLDTGSIAAAARSVGVHRKTLERHAGRLHYQDRRRAILTEVQKRTDAQETDRLTNEQARSMRHWKSILSDTETRNAVIAVLREFIPRPT